LIFFLKEEEEEGRQNTRGMERRSRMEECREEWNRNSGKGR
jgi:hypothetical protein